MTALELNGIVSTQAMLRRMVQVIINTARERITVHMLDFDPESLVAGAEFYKITHAHLLQHFWRWTVKCFGMKPSKLLRVLKHRARRMRGLSTAEQAHHGSSAFSSSTQ